MNSLNGMARSMPPIMQVMKGIGSFEVSEFLARLSTVQVDRKQPAKIDPTSSGA